MVSQQDMILAICQNPSDDLIRLVYSDWLEDHDRPVRAEFIRCQCLGMEQRALELQGAPRCDWWDDYGGKEVHVLEWSRGFVSRIAVSCGFWLEHGPRIVQLQPIEGVRLTDREAVESVSGWWWASVRAVATRPRSVLPDELFFPMVRPKLKTAVLTQSYISRDAALAALSRAALSWARQQAGLPALP